MNIFSKRVKKSVATICLIAIIALPLASFPIRANAAPGLGVPVDTSFNYHSIMDNWKEFVGNKLAVLIANQLIQRMTSSVVNWINTGFEGSPAFLTNPEAFFLDTADQITGELIAKTGALASLCSPFSLDIRLNIALKQATYESTRYTCTLGRIIGNTQNAVATAGQNSGLDFYSSPDGATIGNFINGDFAQGGWGGFIAYSTQPQNNPIGATLMAESDLNSRIAQRHSAINADLNRGSGFLSWQKCDEVASVGSDNPFLDPNSSYDPSATAGAVATKKVCTTQTPGSVIGEQLNQHMGAGLQKVVGIKTISDSIDAIMGALVNQMLTQGLAALSERTSGTVGGRSYLSDLYLESTQPIIVGNPSNSVSDIYNRYISTYDSAIKSVNQSKSAYQAAQACFQAKLNVLLAQNNQNSFIFNDRAQQIIYGQSQIAAIDSIIKITIDPLIERLTTTRQTGQTELDVYRNANTYSNSNTNSNQVYINQQNSNLNSAVNTESVTSNIAVNGLTEAEAEAANIQKQVDGFNADASRYQSLCTTYPNSISVFGEPLR